MIRRSAHVGNVAGAGFKQFAFPENEMSKLTKAAKKLKRELKARAKEAEIAERYTQPYLADAEARVKAAAEFAATLASSPREPAEDAASVARIVEDSQRVARLAQLEADNARLRADASNQAERDKESKKRLIELGVRAGVITESDRPQFEKGELSFVEASLDLRRGVPASAFTEATPAKKQAEQAPPPAAKDEMPAEFLELAALSGIKNAKAAYQEMLADQATGFSMSNPPAPPPPASTAFPILGHGLA